MASLRVISGTLADTTIEITGEISIGRAAADLTLDDGKVSRRHAIVRHRDGVLEIEDLGSSNGTFVDGERITAPTVIGEGTKVRIGRTHFVVEVDKASAETVPGVRPTRIRHEPPLDPQMTRARPVGASGPPTVAAPGPAPAAQPRRGAPGGPGRGVPGGPGPRGPGRGAPGGPGRGGPGGPGPRVPAVMLVRRFRIPIAVLVLAIIAIVLVVALGSSSSSVVDVPVQFTVVDQNRSLVKCGASGGTLHVAAELVTPGTQTSAVTMYLHGPIFNGEFAFHNDLVPGYDFAREMAKLGQSSLVVDRVGYGRTKPYPANGAAYCDGAQADILHQIVSDLRHGHYTVGSSSASPTAFGRVVMAPFAISGAIGEIEAASFHDVDGLILIDWADQDFGSFGTPIPVLLAHCRPGLPKPPGGVGGYTHILPPNQVRSLLSPQADPRILALLQQHVEADPCGQEITGQIWFAGADHPGRASIKVPVLIIHGQHDVLYNPAAWQAQYQAFTGTKDRTLTAIPDGQMLMLDRHAAQTRHVIAGWLKARGL